MPQYPFSAAVRGSKNTEYDKRMSKTKGKTGIGRTRERLNWQKRHHAEAKTMHDKTVDALQKRGRELNVAESRLAKAQNAVRAASPARKAALQKNLNAAMKDAKSARNEYSIWKKRLYKRELEMKRLEKSMAKNTAKLNAKLAAKPAAKASTTEGKTPDANTGNKNAKGRTIYKTKRGAQYVMQNGKKIYIKKAESVIRSPVRNKTSPKANVKKCGGDIKCAVPGLMQVTNTCWFNSALNGLVLADKTAKHLLDMACELASKYKYEKNDKTTLSCPLEPTKDYVLRYVRDVHEKSTRRINRLKENNVSLKFVQSTFTPGRLYTPVKTGESGHDAADGLITLMKRCFPGKYVVSDSYSIHKDLQRYKDLKKPKQFAILTNRMAPLGALSNLPMEIDDYVLSSVVYSITDPQYAHIMSHAVAAYVCNGRKFVFDSQNKKPPLEIDWSDPANTASILAFSKIDSFTPSILREVICVVYARKTD